MKHKNNTEISALLSHKIAWNLLCCMYVGIHRPSGFRPSWSVVGPSSSSFKTSSPQAVFGQAKPNFFCSVYGSCSGGGGDNFQMKL